MPLDLARIQGLCFDVDGTLSDTDDAYVGRISRALHPLRFLFRSGDPTRFSRWLVMASESPMNSLYYWADRMSLDDNFARLFEWLARRRHPKKHFMLMHGADTLLPACAAHYPISVVSARDEGSTRRFLDQFSLSSLFHNVVTSQTCEHTKPFSDPVLHSVKKMGLLPENCVMIGDTTVDILAGKRAGAQTVGLLCGFGTEAELRKAGADVILRDLAELKAALQV